MYPGNLRLMADQFMYVYTFDIHYFYYYYVYTCFDNRAMLSYYSLLDKNYNKFIYRSLSYN
jgi:hypothetical protein